MATSDSSLHMKGLPIGIYAPETVGCVVVDRYGNCNAATSTGGLMNKMNGRIGDSQLIGADTYACDICVMSCTGEGEMIIRSALVRDVAAVMEYKGVGLQEAVDFVIKERLDEGKAGLIAVSNNGDVVCGFNANGMFRGLATEGWVYGSCYLGVMIEKYEFSYNSLMKNLGVINPVPKCSKAKVVDA